MKTKHILLLSASLMFSSLLVGQYVANDIYWGGDPSDGSEGDVLGSDTFSLTHTETFINSGDLTINIFGNYFDNVASNVGLGGTSLGDLFISIDGLVWTDGGAATTGDYIGGPDGHSTWEYGVSLGVYDNTGVDITDGSNPIAANVYSDPSDVILSTGNTYRKNQEWKFVPNGNNEVGSASWYIDTAGNVADDDFLSITIFGFRDIFTEISNPNELAIHWTMSCANDVIEVNPVPEPSTIGILGAAGLMGVLFIRRRLAKRK